MNLVNQHGSELVLSKAFEEQAAAFAKTGRGFRLITFDFHKQCGATSYHKCVRLLSPSRAQVLKREIALLLHLHRRRLANAVDRVLDCLAWAKCIAEYFEPLLPCAAQHAWYEVLHTEWPEQRCSS